jgi:medium-chain acyl-[acyl-carrier-protein] hydrolase
MSTGTDAVTAWSNTEVDRRWIKRFGRRRTEADLRLLCFHHAGGSASLYRGWPAALPEHVEPMAVQLPGRADRFREPVHERMDELMEELVTAVEPVLDRPFACYGLSMGARVAWSLAHELRERGMPQPRALFVASCAAPALDTRHFEWEGRPDGLEGYVREMGGTPDEVLAEPALLATLLPILRSDLTVLETHTLRPDTPLDVPIHAFAGRDDAAASPERMRGWASETTGAFTLDELDSGHFPDEAAERRILAALTRGLS